MEREYKDLVVNEPDGGVYFELVDRAGKTALGPVRARLKSPVKQQGDRWNAAAANLLLRLDEAGRPKLCIPPQAVGGLCPCTHQKAGKVHRLTGEGENLRFAATADFAGGDTFTFNGRAMTARTLAGEPLWPGYFKAGSVVVCHKNGDALTFSGGGGLSSADKKTAEDFLPETKSLLGGSVKGKVPVLGAKRWIPTGSDQQIPAGRYTGGVQTVAGDSSLKPENIRKDVRLFGVPGTYDGDHKGLAASMFNTLMMGWGTAEVGSANRDLFDVSGNALIVKRELQLRFVTHVWCYYDWDQRTTVAGEFVVNGTKKANCTLQLAPQKWDEQMKSDTMLVSVGTRIEFNTTATENWKACGGAVGFIEVV